MVVLSLQRYTDSDMSDSIRKLWEERMDEGRKTSMSFSAIDFVPDSSPDVIIEILSWLPPKELLQFKCVCKLWYSVISSPLFISKHLRNYYKNHNDSCRNCLLVHYYVDYAELELHALLVDVGIPRVLATQQITYDRPIYQSYVCGPCNGIYYLYNYNMEHRTLWNPTTNELKPLPDIICKPNLPSDITYAPMDEGYGFGLDPITGDYKVVVIKDYWRTDAEDNNLGKPQLPLSVLVYSLRTNSWTYCGDLPTASCLEYPNCYMYVELEGCYFWYGSSRNDFRPEVIISFDMATNVIQEMDVPDYVKPSSNVLAIYDDSLAFLSLHKAQKILDIWTWKEGSWTKKFTTNPLLDIWNPIGHWKDNYILLETNDRKLVLFNPASHELKNLGFQVHERKCEGVFAYMESLVSLKGESEISAATTEGVEEIEAKFN